MEVTDLSTVWVWADFYESEIAALHPGQPVRVTSPAYPGETFQGQVAVIEPSVDAEKRTTRVRIDLATPEPACAPACMWTPICNRRHHRTRRAAERDPAHRPA
ncbi:MAG: efflux RND transporter periplasmic adaptor subunit [Chthoniobacteraceae bacterium]